MPEYEYPRPALTADAVVLADGDPRRVLLIQRANAPFAGSWALPGGFVDEDEPTRAAAIRELQEETGLQVYAAAMVGVYDAPGRDPRGWTVSVAYLAMVPEADEPHGADDAADARWWPVDALPADLAFDHAKILADALELVGP